MRLLMTSVLAIVLTQGVGANAKTPLRDVPEIDDALLWVALAIDISDKCDEILPRKLKGLTVLYGLKRRALALGYTDAEIDAYVGNPDEKARMRKRGERYVRSRGLDPSNPAALCKIGHVEIDRSSAIGILLRAR